MSVIGISLPFGILAHPRPEKGHVCRPVRDKHTIVNDKGFADKNGTLYPDPARTDVHDCTIDQSSKTLSQARDNLIIVMKRNK